MFELPEAKRVRRAELDASDQSVGDQSADEGYYEDLRARLNAQIAQNLVFADPGSPLQGEAQGDGPTKVVKDMDDVASDADTVDKELEKADEEAYEFRLFGTSASVPKVILETDDQPEGEGGFAVPKRPLSHYLAVDVPASRKREYAAAAVSADDVLAWSLRRSWALEQPWRVTSISATRKAAAAGTDTHAEDDEAGQRRKRPGKKRRIALRTKQRASEAKKEAKAKKALEKEEHIKDKKKRLNRAKKLRRRAKAKEKKGLGGEEAGAGAESSGSDDGSD
ncbi:hypothetical protein S7711_03773 [Stachybotrys chartarum IBT 7711]|uniref:Uncharacterized protein n=1 Tax=Stachybotrys chartarum (strain CBS 109288 / IBT 7711) TaxID=1280523 RepID=A0A084AWW6_STACB|nr:hypothetical protein S7711_03773 [Stachybotrys chartarum IBT 7711]KFA47147.1 hypothetical protein S40293_09383 [Stachybotrys chartarum IBT 40293]KFA78531.1 hypothetical protein S40288_01440 [Stachybotrys chartarum IBT 40288]